MKSFNTYPLNPMAAQPDDTVLFSDAKVFFTAIKGKGDGDLFTIIQKGGFAFIDRGDLEENLSRFKRAACLEVGPIDLIDGARDFFRFKMGTL